MRILLIFGLILLVSCDAPKKTLGHGQKTKTAKSQCPEQGKCSWELLRDKSLAIQKDGTGMMYPEFVENPETSVIKFQYHRDSPTGVSDGQYTEEIYFEIGNDVKSLTLQNENLQKVKLLHRRMCFCERGTVGYFKVTEGLLEYSKNKNGEATISLVFQNHQVPQVLEELDGKVIFE